MEHRFERIAVAIALLALFAAPLVASDVPAGFAEVVVLATEKLDIDKELEVISGDLIVNDVDGELKIDKDAVTSGGFRLAADDVEIKKDSIIGGDVAYNTLKNEGTIVGNEITPLALPVFAALPPFEAAAPAGDDVEVDDGATLKLDPGAYGKLDVGKNATVVFAGGVYDFEEIKVEKDSALLFDAASRVRVEDKLETKEGCSIGPAAGATIGGADIIFYAGSDVKLEKSCVAAATFYAPDAKIELKKDVQLTGALVGREVKIDKNATLTLESFFNEGPVAVDDSATVDEGGAVSVLDSGAASLLANDSDPNPGDTLSVTPTPVAGPDNGIVTLAADGTFTYVHDGSDTLADAFVYEVCDDGVPVHCATATVSITVNPVNDPPTAVDDAAETDEDTPVVIDVLANDSDVDGNLDATSVSVTSGPASGSTSVDALSGAVTYTPDADFFGSDSFTYEVCDDGVPPPVLCASATVTVTVNAVNDPPIAVDDAAETDEGTPVVIDVLANDSDVDGSLDASSVTVTSGPADGSTAVDALTGAVTYTPDADFFGSDSFTYEVCDDGVPPPVLCASATVNVTVNGINDPPTAGDDSATTDEDTPVVIDVLANDADSDGSLDPASVTVTSGPANGSTSVAAGTGAITYTPAENFSGSDSFDYEVCDDGVPPPVLCASATVTVTVIAVNDPPVARNDQASTSPNTPVTVQVLFNDDDPDGGLDPASVTVIGTVANATVAVSNGTIGVFPDAGFTGTIVFDYQVCDDGVPPPVLCATATVTVTVAEPGVNRPPVANDESEQVPPGTSAVITISASDPDGDQLSFSLVSSPTQGTVTPPSPLTLTSAQVTYSANAGASGSDSFDFQVADGNGGTDIGTVTISFAGGNRRPQTQPDRAVVTQGQSVSVLITGATQLTANDVDPDGDALEMTTTPVSGPSAGSVVLAANGAFTYTHGGGPETIDTMVYEVCDTGVPILCSNGTLTVEIRAQGVVVDIVKAGTGTGTVTSAPAGIACGPTCSATFPVASRVSLDAVADAGSTFVGWSGDADCDDAELRLLAATTCVATFDLLPPPDDEATLTIVKQGNGEGSVASNPAGIVCGNRCAADFPLGSTVFLLVRPDGGSVFAGWTGDADCTDGVVTMTEDLTCIATFDP